MTRGDTAELDLFLEEQATCPAFAALMMHLFEGADPAELAIRRNITGELLNLALYRPYINGDQVGEMLQRTDGLESDGMLLRLSTELSPELTASLSSVWKRESDPAWRAWAKSAAAKLGFTYLADRGVHLG